MPSVIQSRKSSAWLTVIGDLPPHRVGARDEIAAIEPAEQDAGHVGQPIPADRDRPELERDGIDDRIGDDEEVHRGPQAFANGRTLDRQPAGCQGARGAQGAALDRDARPTP